MELSDLKVGMRLIFRDNEAFYVSRVYPLRWGGCLVARLKRDEIGSSCFEYVFSPHSWKYDWKVDR